MNEREMSKLVLIEYNQEDDTLEITGLKEALDRNYMAAAKGEPLKYAPLAVTNNPRNATQVAVHVRARINGERAETKKEPLKHVRKLTIPDEDQE